MQNTIWTKLYEVEDQWLLDKGKSKDCQYKGFQSCQTGFKKRVYFKFSR